MALIDVDSAAEKATHALVIGVSRYRHIGDGSEPTDQGKDFGLDQLSAAARSASDFAGWLLREHTIPGRPLGTLRICLSPSPNEQLDEDVVSHLAGLGDYAATRANVEADLGGFVAACRAHPDNVGIVYVAGHGVQLTKHEAVVLLEDFGSNRFINELGGAIDMAGCHRGLNHAGAAGTQFWFVDACRQRPRVASRFESVAGALTLSERTGAVTTTSPLIMASTTREAAFAEVDGQTLFVQALLWALRGGAAEATDDEWHVPILRLISKIQRKVSDIAKNHREEQNVDVSGRVLDALLHRLAAPPRVEVSLKVVPAVAQDDARAELLRDATELMADEGSDWPRRWVVAAGLYQLRVEADQPWHPPQQSKLLNVQTHELACTVEVRQ